LLEVLTQTIPLTFASAISLSLGAFVASVVFALEDLVVFDSFDGAVCADEVPCNAGPIEKIKLNHKTAINLFIKFIIFLSLLSEFTEAAQESVIDGSSVYDKKTLSIKSDNVKPGVDDSLGKSHVLLTCWRVSGE
jgi:hypothetical protein